MDMVLDLPMPRCWRDHKPRKPWALVVKHNGLVKFKFKTRDEARRARRSSDWWNLRVEKLT